MNLLNIYSTSGSPAGIMNWYPSKMELKQEQAVSSVGSLGLCLYIC